MIVQKLNTDELSSFKSLLDIFQEVFEVDGVKPADEYLAALLTDPHFMVFVVAYIYDVGIHPGYQGRGLGKMLMSAVCSYFEQNGFDHAYVKAEADDFEAIRFYRKTKGSTEMNAVHFTYLFQTKE